MGWLILIVAGLFEMLGVAFINRWHESKKQLDLAGMVVFFVLSFIGLSIAMEELPISTAYAVWTGIGAGGSALMGMLFFGESKNTWRLFFISLIICATIGLKVIS